MLHPGCYIDFFFLRKREDVNAFFRFGKNIEIIPYYIFYFNRYLEMFNS